MTVSPEEIAWAYRLVLGREASREEIGVWRDVGSLAELRRLFLASPEFRSSRDAAGVAGTGAEAEARLPQNLAPLHVEWHTDAATEALLLERTTRTWTLLGRERPHWSVLSADAFLPERIEENSSAFYASGAGEAERIVTTLARHGLSPSDTPRVLEYGCGVGRVTPHLASTFRSVAACDISESHLALARERVERSGYSGVGFVLVRAPEFGLVEPYDLWFSHIVLQHNPPPVIALVLRRALGRLAPGGIAMFQVPTYALGYRFVTSDYLAHPTDLGTIEVHCLPQAAVFGIVADSGCVPLEVREDSAMGPPSAWLSNTFVVRKAA